MTLVYRFRYFEESLCLTVLQQNILIHRLTNNPSILSSPVSLSLLNFSAKYLWCSLSHDNSIYVPFIIEKILYFILPNLSRAKFDFEA
jgi:hypothetical protein